MEIVKKFIKNIPDIKHLILRYVLIILAYSIIILLVFVDVRVAVILVVIQMFLFDIRDYFFERYMSSVQGFMKCVLIKLDGVCKTQGYKKNGEIE